MRSFAYTRAQTVQQAIQALASGGAETRVLAGGTTLYDLMKLRVEQPARVVDVNAIRELSHFDTADERELTFGALARMSDVAADPTLAKHYPALAESLWKAASQQLRNMASLGGNLLQRTRCPYFRGGDAFPCNKRRPESGCSAIDGIDRSHALLGTSEACIATYPGDFAVALVAFDAVVDLLGARGERTVALEALHREPANTPHLETALAPDELIIRIRVPAARIGKASTYHKIRDRESYAFALSAAAVALDLDGGIVREARIALGGVATKPWRARTAERVLVGKRLSTETVLAAGDEAFRTARRGKHNAFRIELGRRTVADALLIAAERA